jgi:hypothetical protein
MIIRPHLGAAGDYSSMPANLINSIAHAAGLQSALRSELINVLH